MDLFDKISEDIKKAMLARDRVRLKSRSKDIKVRTIHMGIRFYQSNLEVDAQYINYSIRIHWSVGNQRHRALDVAFGDDASRKEKNAVQNFYLLHRIALNIIKNAKVSSTIVKGHREKAGWDNDYLLYALKSFDIVKN